MRVKYKWQIFLWIISLVNPITVLSQNRKVTIEVTKVSNTDEYFTETVIGRNPVDSLNIIISAVITNKSGDGAKGTAVYYTLNNGLTWERSVISTGEMNFPDVDPSITFDRNGVAYLSTLFNGFTIWKSLNKGKTWELFKTVPGSSAYDREWIVVDTSAKKNVLLAYGKFTVKILGEPVKSSGLLFNEMDLLAISKIDLDNPVQFSHPKLFIPHTQVEGINHTNFLSVSLDGTIMAGYTTFPVGTEMSDSVVSGKISIIRSNNSAKTFQQPVHISEFRMIGRANEQKSIKCLCSGSFTESKNTLTGNSGMYFIWVEWIDGYCQAVYSYSTEDGISWSEKQRASTSGYNSDMSNPGIAINNKGIALAAWYDRRNGNGNSFQLYGTIIVNGRAQAEFIIDRAFTFPCGNNSGCRYSNGGDTFGITNLHDGSFGLAYIRDDDKVNGLYFARVFILEK